MLIKLAITDYLTIGMKTVMLVETIDLRLLHAFVYISI